MDYRVGGHPGPEEGAALGEFTNNNEVNKVS